MNPQKMVLVTGASGLLGQEIVKALVARGHRVMAQYFSHPMETTSQIQPVYGDLSDLDGVIAFWQKNRQQLCAIDYFFSNYGPITHKKTEELEYADFLADFSAHLAPLIFIVKRLKAERRLKGVMASGVEEVGSEKGYRHILAHACAKGAVEMVIRSWQLVWPDLLALYWPIPSLSGASIPHRGTPGAPVTVVAKEMVNALLWGA